MQALAQLSATFRFGLVGVVMLALVTITAFAQAPRLDVVFVPTPQEVVDRMLEMAAVKEGEFLIDLGSGDGRIPVTAAKTYGVRALGVDINPQRVAEGRASAQREGVEHLVEFREQNLYHTDFSQADVLTMYLLYEINANLRPKILDTLRPGTRVVSHAFDMGEWMPDEEDKVGYRLVYLWIVPAKVEGAWKLAAGELTAALNIEQRYQRLSGEAMVAGATVELEDARLRGAEISFAVTVNGERRSFAGTVDGDRIEGDAKRSGGVAWNATRG